MTQTFEDWIDALNLKPRGKKAEAPCPLCGGDDRFRITRGDTVPVLLACRSCLDLLQGEARAKRIKEITRAVFGDAASPPVRSGNGVHPAKPGIQIADADTLDRAYRIVLDRLTLSQRHWEDLRRRGLSESFIELAQYRTLPEGQGDAIAGVLLDELGEDARRVPGVHPVECRFIAYPGLIIPVRDARTRIVALRVRKDEGAPRYSFVSSASVEPGPGPGAPAHVPVIRPTPATRKDMTPGDVVEYHPTVRVTEGELKADVATALSIEREEPPLLTIGLNGPSAFEVAVPALKALGTETVIVALDSDAREKRPVAAALRRTVDGLRESGFGVELETWAGGKDGAKGIDNAILANVEITRHSDDADDDQVDAEIKEIDRAAKLAQPTPEEKREADALKTLKDAVFSEDRGEWKEQTAQAALRRIAKSEPALERARAIVEESPISMRQFERNVKAFRGESEERAAQETMRFEGHYYHDVAKVIGNLSKAGRLMGTTDGIAYYHVEETGELLRITGTAKQRDLVRPFLTRLHDEYGIISTQHIGPALLDTLDIMAMRPPHFEMKTITKLDRPTRTMYLDMGNHSVLRVTPKDIRAGRQGMDDVFFEESKMYAPWEYVAASDGLDDLDRLAMWFTEGMQVDEEMQGIPRECAQVMFLTYVLSLFFHDLLRTKPIALTVGPYNSGKTETFLRVLQTILGPEMADHIKTDTPSTSEAFDVAGSNFDYVLIDNADKYVDWFAQALSTAATGKARIDRTKYSDNDVSTFLSRAFVMISSRTPWFRQDDVASRLLIWHLKRMPATVGVDEQDRYDEVLPRRNELMSAVARVIQRVLQGPDYESLDVKHESRLRNWIRLATWIGESYDPIFRDSLAVGIENIIPLFQQFTSEDSDLPELISQWLSEPPPGQTLGTATNEYRVVTTGELRKELGNIAKDNNVKFRWNTIKSFGQYMNQQEESLKLRFIVRTKADGSQLKPHGESGTQWNFSKKPD